MEQEEWWPMFKAIGVVLVSLLLTLNIFHTCSSVSIVNFEQVNAGWGATILESFKNYFSLKKRMTLKF